MAAEPSGWLVLSSASLWWVTPYISYFVGIWVNHYALSKEGDLPLKKQFALGLPVSLVIVSTYTLTYLAKNPLSLDQTYLITLGLIMINGFSVSTVSENLKKNYGGTSIKAPP